MNKKKLQKTKRSGRKKRTRAHVIADMSYHHLAYLVVSCAFTVEANRSDYGYDLSIYTFDGDGRSENGNIYVQLKASDSLSFNREDDTVSFRISKRDIETWEGEPFPVYLVVFDTSEQKSYSIYLQKYFQANAISAATMAHDSINVQVPARAVDATMINNWRSDKNAIIAQIGAVQHV